MFISQIRTTVTRTLAGASLMASVIGVSALGAVGIANAAPVGPPPAGYSVYTCYDYATQIFYDCV